MNNVLFKKTSSGKWYFKFVPKFSTQNENQFLDTCTILKSYECNLFISALCFNSYLSVTRVSMKNPSGKYFRGMLTPYAPTDMIRTKEVIYGNMYV